MLRRKPGAHVKSKNIQRKGGISMEKRDLSSIIRKDREEHKSKKFEGTFLDYLDIVKENPEVAMLAHQRMYKLITDPGVKVIETDENPRLRRIYGNDV